MIILDAPQRSLDWLTQRLWRLTGSQMSKNITSTGKLSESATATANLDKLIAGMTAANILRGNPSLMDGKDDAEMQRWLANFTGEKFFGNLHTQRGNDQESDALAALSAHIDEQITDVGMCVMGDNPMGVVSCSPDGLIYHDGEIVAGAEVKCPTLATFYGYVTDGRLPDEYKLQVHSAMVICEVNLWHFAAYFAGQPLFHIEVKRDKFTETLSGSLNAFRDQYERRYYEVTKAMENLTSNKKSN